MPDEVTTRLPVLYLYCNWRDSGWSERYWLRPQSWPEALAQGARIARWRIAAACTDTELIWGRIAFTDNPRLTAPLPNLGIRAIPRTGIGDGQLHTVYTRLHWRFETLAGDWVDRRVAGIPDDAIGPNGVTGDLETLRAGELPPDVDDPAASWLLTFRAFMTVLRDETVYASKRGVADPEFWRVVPWSKVLFRSPTTRNTGRDFRRVTWLPAMTKPPAAAGIDPPWDAAPAFNPCGAAVGVTRSCYSRACRWYVNGPIGRIRFAFVDRCAKILPYPTVFWPYSGDRELVNANEAGEITAEKFPFNTGRRRSQATGLHPIGTAADFAGESLVPWDPATPTPPERIPCCAFGELQMEAIEYVRVTVDALPDLFTPAGGILTANVNARLADLDGRTLVKGDRLLLNNGLASAGIYTLTDVGKDDPSGRPWKLQRLQTCDGTAEYSPGQVIKVWDGDDNAHTLWELETDPPYVLDTTPLDFAELAGGGGADKVSAVKILSGNAYDGFVGMRQKHVGGVWVDIATVTVREMNDRILRPGRRYLAHQELDIWAAWNQACPNCDPTYVAPPAIGTVEFYFANNFTVNDGASLKGLHFVARDSGGTGISGLVATLSNTGNAHLQDSFGGAIGPDVTSVSGGFGDTQYTDLSNETVTATAEIHNWGTVVTQHARFGPVGTTFPPIDPTKCIIEPLALTCPADGSTHLIVRVQVLNAAEVPLTFYHVSLTATGSAHVISSPITSSSPLGEAFFHVTNSTIETCTFSASVTEDGGVSFGPSVAVDFVAP